MSDEKYNIIFVDDEVNVLDGLRRLLRPKRREWDMTFVSSGHDAIEAMQEKPYQVIVSDMRMPRMDGAELLRYTRDKYPQMIRIVLSGFSDFEQTLRTVNAAHQYLAKPCDGDILVDTIQRALALRAMLSQPNIQGVVSQISNLPSPPDIYDALHRECESKAGSCHNIGEIIARDPALTAKLLQMVNSSFFGARRKISSVDEAVSMLGVEMVKSLLAAVHVFEDSSALPPSMQYLWQHSIDTANYARAIQMHESQHQKFAELAFTAGLLHDIGKLVLLRGIPDRYEPMIVKAEGNDVELTRRERDELGTDHGRIGAYLMGLWGLPDSIVEAVAYHHSPGELGNGEFSTVTAVHVADAFNLSDHGKVPEPPLDQHYLDRLNVQDRVATWRGICRKVGHGGIAA